MKVEMMPTVPSTAALSLGERTLAACGNLSLVEPQAVKPEDLTVIGHVGDLLADIYAAKRRISTFYRMLNASGEPAQSRRNGCSISAVEVRNLKRNTHFLHTASHPVR